MDRVCSGTASQSWRLSTSRTTTAPESEGEADGIPSAGIMPNVVYSVSIRGLFVIHCSDEHRALNQSSTCSRFFSIPSGEPFQVRLFVGNLSSKGAIRVNGSLFRSENISDSLKNHIT
jgi:hypothetical protein